MRVALAHDWVVGLRGGEKVLDELAHLYPRADLHTLFYAPGTTTDAIDRLSVHASALSRLPLASRHYRKLLPLMPRAVESLRIAPCDVVVSSSHCVAKGVLAPPGAAHLCYCFTPMRYVWDQADAYLGRGLRRTLATPLVRYLRRWDEESSGPERVTRFVAISTAVAKRIEQHYGRDADVIHPPVAVDRIECASGPPEDFFLLVGGFVPYKRESLAIQAFARLGVPLVVAGDGPARARLMRDAPPHVHFVGRVSDDVLHDLYRRCRALIYPQEEDFGIVAVEAQAAGRPVIAFGRGGALDTVVPPGGEHQTPPTGLFFTDDSEDALIDAVERFERAAGDFDPKAIRSWAERFSRARFRRELAAAVRSVCASRSCA
jgi:glycosyltransferase involved in cell wall biosynthesis